MSTPRIAAVLAYSTIWLAGIGAGIGLGHAAVARAQDPYASFDLLARVFGIIERDHADPPDAQELAVAAIEGMVDALDPHSDWMDLQQLEAVSSFGGPTGVQVGVDLRPGASGTVIVSVLAGSPAARAGLRTGDLIRAIDGRSTADQPTDAVQGWLAGERGTPVALEILRGEDGRVDAMTIVRDVVENPLLTQERLPNDLLYLRLHEFADGSARAIDAALATHADARALILDLRDNAGGRMSEALSVADAFLDGGLIATERVRGAPDAIHQATAGGDVQRPLIVLINGQTASASELVAAALRAHRRATLVGSPTYGKGTIQQVYREQDPGAWALRLTVGHYETAEGQRLTQGQGISPDELVNDPLALGARDELVQRLRTSDLPEDDVAALLALLDEVAPASTPTSIPWEVPASTRLDPPLTKARMLLALNQ